MESTDAQHREDSGKAARSLWPSGLRPGLILLATSRSAPTPVSILGGIVMSGGGSLVRRIDTHVGEAQVAFGRNKETGPAPLESYDVTYKGGLPHLPKAKIGKIVWEIWDDHFQFNPSTASKKFWEPLTIPYEAIADLSVVGRQVSTFEALAGGLNSKQLNQDNNINIAYDSTVGPVVLRFEMLSGVTVMGQAKKCLEMQDRLRTHQILTRFGGRAASNGVPAGGQADIPAQIHALAQLHAQGILSTEEFESKKSDLLSRM
jgi:hypothetical protein